MINVNSINKIMEARGQIRKEEHPGKLDTWTVDGFVNAIANSLDNVIRHLTYGEKEKALDELAYTLAYGVCCFDHNLDEGKEQPAGKKNGREKAKKELMKSLEDIQSNSPVVIPVEELNTDQLILIAKYEMYATLELKYMQHFVNKWISQLSLRDQELVNNYMAAKLGVMTSNQSLSLIRNKKADAEA